MDQIELKDLRDYLENKMQNTHLPSVVLLDRLRLTTEDSRRTAAYQDPRYVPFYYWLGTKIEPKSMVEIGFRLGLFSSCFFKACKTVEHFFGFQEDTGEYYSKKLGIANVKDNYKGKLDFYLGKTTDDQFFDHIDASKWDLAIVNEETSYDKHREYLDLLWPKLNPGALIIMDYVSRHTPAKESYLDFCKAKNREPMTLSTRYGVGLLQR